MVQVTDAPLSANAPLVEAVQRIESSMRRIAVVIDAAGILIGTLTDGDVRRCLLAGGSLATEVREAMNASPASAPSDASDAAILALMRKRNILAVPLVDDAGRFLRLVHLRDLEPADRDGDASGFEFAVIMAGGEGMRLRPITASIPKPMVDIAGVPLLERQISRLAKSGVPLIYIAVNYLGHMIEEHFDDGARFGAEIRYLRETQKLGTAGALTLLPEIPDRPIMVMNGDILTACDFGSLRAFHESQRAEVTVAAVEYRIDVPFGVIRAEGPYVRELVEKPSQRFLCNAGLYAVSPSALRSLRAGTFINMTDIIATSLREGRQVAVFPMHEYWSDVGTHDDLDQARRMFTQSASSS
jgi:dTDP-glucose pyrophosphorylase